MQTSQCPCAIRLHQMRHCVNRSTSYSCMLSSTFRLPLRRGLPRLQIRTEENPRCSAPPKSRCTEDRVCGKGEMTCSTPSSTWNVLDLSSDSSGLVVNYAYDRILSSQFQLQTVRIFRITVSAILTTNRNTFIPVGSIVKPSDEY